VRSCLCMIAGASPRLFDKANMLANTATIAMRPKSAGSKRRASTATTMNVVTSLVNWEVAVQVTPLTVLVLRLTSRTSVQLDSGSRYGGLSYFLDRCYKFPVFPPTAPCRLAHQQCERQRRNSRNRFVSVPSILRLYSGEYRSLEVEDQTAHRRLGYPRTPLLSFCGEPVFCSQLLAPIFGLWSNGAHW